MLYFVKNKKNALVEERLLVAANVAHACKASISRAVRRISLTYGKYRSRSVYRVLLCKTKHITLYQRKQTIPQSTLLTAPFTQGGRENRIKFLHNACEASISLAVRQISLVVDEFHVLQRKTFHCCARATLTTCLRRRTFYRIPACTRASNRPKLRCAFPSSACART